MINDIVFEGIVTREPWRFTDDLFFRLATYRDTDLPPKPLDAERDQADYINVRVCGGANGLMSIQRGMVQYTHELGWRCSQGGLSHFLQQKFNRIRKNWEEHPYLIPPAPGYPSVRRDEILTYEDLLPLYRRWAEEGYDPTA